jgi:hypothetical protein
MFFFVFFDFEYLRRAASYKNESNLLLVGITVCLESFPQDSPAFLEHGSAEKRMIRGIFV